MAKENPGWGYDRIVGALANLGFLLSDQTVGNILRRHGLSPAPKRKQAISWKDFTRSHMEVLVGTDFFTVEILTLALSQSIPRQLFSRSEKIIKSSTTTTKKDTAQRIVNQSGCESFGGWPIQRRNRSPSTSLIIPRSEKRPRNRRSAPSERPSEKASFRRLAVPKRGACV